jgi:two-component system, sensor histidine kinase and response regulator
MSEMEEGTILVVDDLPENLDIVGELLKGYKQKVATNGAKALKIAASDSPPNLILLDVMMPEMDGLEVCEKLKSDPLTKDIPVIFITAKNQPEDILKGFKAGGVDYVTKPFNPPELLARVQTHLKLRNTETELRDLIRMKDRLFSIIGHDLRGPLGNLMMLMETILDEGSNKTAEEIKKYMGMMRDSSKGAYNLLENLLSWARSQQKLVQFNPAMLNLSDLINENLSVLEGMANNKGINLVNKFEPSVMVFCDKNSVSTIIRNLISNALKFTNKNGAITIGFMDEREYIQIYVEDTGIGMSPENVSKLFKQSSIFSTRGTGGEKGTGLGLLLCKDFVEGNNGKIWVDSELGKGSRISFTLQKSEY